MVKYIDWLIKENLIVVQFWVIEGVMDEQVVKNIGIVKIIFYEWKKKYFEFVVVFKKGKVVVDVFVENVLFKVVMVGEFWVVCFWFKNRCLDKWCDKFDIESNINLMIVIKDEYGDEDDGG